MPHPPTHQFDPVIYPRLLWVYFGAHPTDITDRFEMEHPANIPTSLKENIATVCLVKSRETGHRGVLVFASRARDITPSVAAHEAVHVADAFFQELAMFSQAFNDSNEPYAYLVGWVANCIWEAKKGVPK